MTKLAEQLQQSGVGQVMRLRTIAYDMLRKCNRNPIAAHDGFVDAVLADRELLVALIGSAAVRTVALSYLQSARDDMARRVANEKDEAKGQPARESRSPHATASSAELPGEGHTEDDAHGILAQPRQPLEDGGGQDCHEAQDWGASPSSPIRSGEGHISGEAHTLSARSAAKPIPIAKRGLGAMAAVQGIMAKSIVFRLQDGRDIMDAQWHELPKLEKQGLNRAGAWMREAIVAKYLRENVTFANPDPFQKVGDLFPQKTIELALKKSEEMEPLHV